MKTLHTVIVGLALAGCAGNEEITPLGKQRPITIRTCKEYCYYFPQKCNAWDRMRARNPSCRVYGPSAIEPRSRTGRSILK